MKRETIARWAKVLAWVAVLALAGFFWLQLQWSRMNTDMTMWQLGRASQQMDRQAQDLAKCELFGVAGKPAPQFKESP